MKYVISLFFAVFFSLSGTKAQELQATVNVNFNKIGGADQQLYQAMQTTISEFLNTRKWTEDIFQQQERIVCNITIMLEERISTNQFKATVQIQSTRPVYNSGYNAVMLNHTDPDWVFEYVEFQPLEFNDNSFLNNLSSLLAFYAFTIIGLDYDSFSLLGGTEFHQRAQQVVVNAQNAVEPGWRQNQNLRNRYWLNENLLNSAFKPFRESLYFYHRLGLDIMHRSENMIEARKQITSAITKMHNVHKTKPGSMLQQVYLNGKLTEIIGIYSKATPAEKSNVLTMLSEIDPPNILQYQKINSP
ncbi:MAG: DUF4835 family protein [Sphingobacteriaceae bacterium]|nr:DUF4835 family protein [Sphingobacteriaceae bacterium]